MNEDRLAWLRERQKGIGGSDVGALLGLSKWKSPVELWRDKVEPIDRETPSSLAAELGNYLEPLIRQKYAETTGNSVRIIREPIVSESFPFMRCNLDGLIETPGGEFGVLQIKTAGSSDEWGAPGTNEVPLPYFWQVQHEMSVADLGFSEIPVLFFDRNRRIEIFRVDRDPVLERKLIDRERAFWNHVERREPPPTKQLRDAKLIFSRVSHGKQITATAELELQLLEIGSLAEEIKDLEEQKDRAEARVREVIEDATEVVDDDGTVLATLRETRRIGVDLDRLRTDHPELATELATESSYRTLRLKKALFTDE